MVKKKKPAKQSTDVNQAAFQMVQRSTGTDEPTENEISRVMSALGKLGGKVGGKRRAEVLSADKRREIALAAARKRWDKK